MEKRILVIGVTGLLGEPVVNCLKHRGFNVRLMVREIEGRQNDLALISKLCKAI